MIRETAGQLQVSRGHSGDFTSPSLCTSFLLLPMFDHGQYSYYYIAIVVLVVDIIFMWGSLVSNVQKQLQTRFGGEVPKGV